VEPPDGGEVPPKRIFVYRPHWFVMAQTVGRLYMPADLPEWQELRALEALGIQRTAFDWLDGNVQGFARGREVAVSPIAARPAKTLFHELAHVLLGHTAETRDGKPLPRNLCEGEAEAVALLCIESLGLEGAPECRGYIQHWLSGQSFPEPSAQKIFRAADQILRAGRPPEAAQD
jgi:hypothetical protein